MTANSSPDFNFIAPWYDFLTRIVSGNSVYKSQEYLVPFISKEDRVLIFGGGTGETLPSVLYREPSEVVFIEKSTKMLERARKRVVACKEKHKVTFLLGDQESELLSGKFDKVILPFVLDLYHKEQIYRLIATLRNYLKDDGKWLVSDFSYQLTVQKSFVFKGFIWLMIRFFRLVANIPVKRLPDWESVFNEQGFKVERDICFFYKMIASRIYVANQSQE